MRFSKHAETKLQHFVYPVAALCLSSSEMPRFSKRQRGNGRGSAISTLSNATSSVGQAALTPRAASTPRTRGCSMKRGNGRKRALSTLSNATSSVVQAALTPRAASTPCTCGRSEKRSREHSDQNSQTAAPPIKRTLLRQIRSATESSRALPLTKADIPHIVDAVINSLQARTQDNVAPQSDDDGDPELYGEW